MSVTINDKDYERNDKTVVSCDKVWTLTFSEPVDVKDVDIKISIYGNKSGDMGFHFWSNEDVKSDFIFQQSAPNQIKVIKGHIGHIYDINSNYTGENLLENDGYYNGIYRIVATSNSKSKSGKTLDKDYIFEYEIKDAGGIRIN